MYDNEHNETPTNSPSLPVTSLQSSDDVIYLPG